MAYFNLLLGWWPIFTIRSVFTFGVVYLGQNALAKIKLICTIEGKKVRALFALLFTCISLTHITCTIVQGKATFWSSQVCFLYLKKSVYSFMFHFFCCPVVSLSSVQNLNDKVVTVRSSDTFWIALLRSVLKAGLCLLT